MSNKRRGSADSGLLGEQLQEIGVMTEVISLKCVRGNHSIRVICL